MVMGFQGATRQQVMGPGGLGDQQHAATQQLRQALAQGGQSGALQNWFAAQDPRIQMGIAAGNVGNGISTPWGNINNNMANRMMSDIRMYGGPSWNDAGAQLQNYASYQNAGTNPYAQNKGLMDFTPGGGSWGGNMAWSNGADMANAMGKYGNQNTDVWGAARSGPAGSFLNAPPGAQQPTGQSQTPPGANNQSPGVQNALSNLGVGGMGWQGQYPNAGSWNPYAPVASGGQTAGVPGQPTGNAGMGGQLTDLGNYSTMYPSSPGVLGSTQTPATVAQPFSRQQRFQAR